MEHVWAHRPTILSDKLLFEDTYRPMSYLELLCGDHSGPIRVKTPYWTEGGIVTVDGKYVEAIIAHNQVEDIVQKEELRPRFWTSDHMGNLTRRLKETDAALPEELRGHNG